MVTFNGAYVLTHFFFPDNSIVGKWEFKLWIYLLKLLRYDDQLNYKTLYNPPKKNSQRPNWCSLVNLILVELRELWI